MLGVAVCFLKLSIIGTFSGSESCICSSIAHLGALTVVTDTGLVDEHVLLKSYMIFHHKFPEKLILPTYSSVCYQESQEPASWHRACTLHCCQFDWGKQMLLNLQFCKILQDLARSCEILQDLARSCKILRDLVTMSKYTDQHFKRCFPYQTNCMSLGRIVIRPACMAQRLVSSITVVMLASAACCMANSRYEWCSDLYGEGI